MNGQLTSTQTDRVEAWATIYDEIYRDGHARGTSADGLQGWVDALSGRPFAADVMWEWRDATVDRIRSLEPQRVLDVGAGTGMIAREIAPDVQAYHAVDPTLEGLRDLLDPGCRPAGMTVERRAAHELDAGTMPGGPPDLVVINSVLQHFPDRTYLDDVLDRALDLLCPGGAILLGDVPDARRGPRRLREIARRSEPWAASRRLDEIVRELADRNSELSIDPWSPEQSHDVRATVLARCLRDGDLARHRVDVILRPGARDGDPGGGAGSTGDHPESGHSELRPVARWEELGATEADRAARTRTLVVGGDAVDVPDGLVCPCGPTASEAARWTPAGASGVHMHRSDPDRLVITASALAPVIRGSGHRTGIETS